MTVETAAKTISLILAPVVMLTACGILVAAMLQHYGAVNDRVRAMTSERLQLVAGRARPDGNGVERERLAEIDHQLPMLLDRHELVRNAILTFYVAVGVFVLSMFFMAGAALAGSGALATVALLVFLGGTGVMLAGLVFFARDIHGSHQSLKYEADRVSRFQPAAGPGPRG